MALTGRYPLYRKDDNEFLGFIVQDTAGWQAQAIFGYLIERTSSQQEAERVLRTKGLNFLTGVWQYFDPDEKEWFPCVIREANQYKVTVTRTNLLGYQDHAMYKVVTLESPTENVLVKSA